MELGVEDGNPDLFRREGVAVRAPGCVRSVHGATQVVGHLRRGVVRIEESGDMPAKALLLVKRVTMWTTRQLAPARAMGR
jgi:hypothetical protein